MDHYFTIITEAVDNLENYLPDAADASETPAEEKKVRDFCNRLARLINQTRDQL